MHYNDVIMDMVAPQFTSLTIVYSTVYSSADQRKHQSTMSLAFVRHKGPVTWKMFPFDDIIMIIMVKRCMYYMPYDISVNKISVIITL